MVIPLNVSHNMEELMKMTELNKAIKLKPIRQLAKSLQLVLKKAEEYYKLGDEESAFIFFMKYFNLVEIIQKHNKFENLNKNERREIFGNKDSMMERMDRLGVLKENLKKRYDEKNHKLEAAKKIDNEKREDLIRKSIDVQNSTFIKCDQLYKRISDAAEAILLLDCRSSSDFDQSQVKYPNMISIPGDVIQNGVTPSLLLKDIAPQYHRLFNLRGKMDLIVLMDEDTSEDQPTNPSKPIWLLRKIFLEWDPDTSYKSISLLDGGFQRFLITYPMRTTNPKYHPKPKEVLASNKMLADIEYPSLSDIKMKPVVSQIPPSTRPLFDRGSKPTFGQMPFDTTVSVVKQREMILDQVLQKQKEVAKIEDELGTVVNAQVPNETEKGDWYKKQDELEYKLVQKEQELNETVTGLHATSTLENKVESFHIDNPEEAEIVARVKAKENERLENERKMKQKMAEIEVKRIAARELQKRHLETKEEEEEIIRPRQPTIDRSVKPSFDSTVKFPQIHRDYSPVHGSYGDIGATGLKNLGNTCYMNSILQCLLNLEGFREYLIRDTYQKHINRKSKTHGLVTEELAQLCKQLWCGKFKSVAARDFRAVIGREHKMFATYDQQDSHELLVILIDMLHSELQIPVDNTAIDRMNKADVAWWEFLKNTQSIIQTMFFGQIRSTVKCTQCGFESATYEGFSHLSLELPQDNRSFELSDCLDLYFYGETIEGWTCPQCKQNRNALKKLDISKLPPVLVIHLKRFHASLDSPNTYIKKQNFVHFPIQDFDISNYLTRSLKQRKAVRTYDLFAVSNHYGTMNRGHYTAFCKNDKSQRWWKYDDNYVTQIASNDVSSSAGYILFYSF